jgi:hypothetical protein
MYAQTARMHLHLDELYVLIEMLTQAMGGMTSWAECLAANEGKTP